MPAFLRRFILFQLIVLIIPLAFMNRHDVALFIDPWSLGNDEAAIHMPLFILILLCLLLGLIIGFAAGRFYSWWTHRQEDTL
jgi:hypothetical protein